MDAAHYRMLERMYHEAPINVAIYQPELLVEHARATLRLEVRPEFYHAANATHGSVYFKALDDACFFACNSLCDVFVLTASFNLYLLAPIHEGTMIAHGQVTHETKSSFIAEATLEDAQGRALARGGGSFVKSKTLLTADIGYK